MHVADAVARMLFGVSAALCVWVYLGYPALIWVLSRLRARPVRRAQVDPSVSFLIPVHNEERVIEAKLQNTLALRYPRERLEVLVLSDGSTDRTADIVRRYADRDVRLVELERGGKLPALNAGAGLARGEIIVFTDANSMLAPVSLEALVAGFADPEVGGVCGNQVYRMPSEGDTTKQGENLYWRYDKWQKGLESRIGSIFAADGSLYAIRRALYRPVDDPAQADDIAISTRVVLQGYRLVFEPRAVTYEDAPAEGRAEFWRKVRVTNRSVRALLNLGRALWSSGFYSLELLSHKLLRHLAPIYLIGLLTANAWLAVGQPGWRGLAALQAAFYSLAFAGWSLRARRLGARRLFTIPYFFTFANAAALLGLISLLRGQRLALWRPRAGAEPGAGSSSSRASPLAEARHANAHRFRPDPRSKS